MEVHWKIPKFQKNSKIPKFQKKAQSNLSQEIIRMKQKLSEDNGMELDSLETGKGRTEEISGVGPPGN